MARKRSSENDVVVSTGSTAAAPTRRKSPARPRVKYSPVEETQGSAAEVATAEVISVVGTAAASQVVAEPEVTAPRHEDIALLAYTYWEQRGFQGGSPEEDWLRAEQALLASATSVA